MEANQGVPGPRCAFYSLETFPGSRTGLPPAASPVQNLFLTFTDTARFTLDLWTFVFNYYAVDMSIPADMKYTNSKTRSTFIGSRVSRVLTEGYSVPYRSSFG